MPKRKSDMPVQSDKKKRKVITLDTKLDVIKQFDNGHSKASISRALGLSGSTVRLIVSKSNEYKEQGKVASHLSVYGALVAEVLFWLKWRIF
jgi:DNA invertase Pin-like site-specific DNA recombinase